MHMVNNMVAFVSGKKKLHFWIFLLLVVLLTTSMMLLYRPICVITDPYFHHNRLLILMQALQGGEFPFYIDYNAINGYGYFSKAFYSDLFLIPYAIIGNITNISFAYGSYIFTSTVLCALSMYWAVKRVYKSTFCASAVAILYTFSAYRIYEIYYHTAVSEVITFIFLPVVFVGLYEIIKGNYKKWYILTLGFSAIIMTHTITVVLLSVTMLIFLVFYYKSFFREKIRIAYLLLAGGSCLILTAYYLYPMLEQMLSNTFFYQTKPFVDIKFTRSLLSSIFAGLTNNLPNMNHSDYTPKVGGLLATLVCLRLFVSDRSKAIRSVDLGVVIGLFYILANAYFFPWTEFPFNKLAFIQFPWRLLKYTTFFFSLAGGFYLCSMLKSDNRKAVVLLFLTVLLVVTFRFDSNDYRDMICTNDEVIDEQTIAANAYIGGGEYLPSVMPSKDYPFERGNVIVNEDNASLITGYIKDKGHLTFVSDSAYLGRLELPLTYYKGYKATIDDRDIEVEQSKNGLIQLDINGRGDVKVWYGGTIIQKMSPYITLLAFILICVYIIVINRKRNA